MGRSRKIKKNILLKKKQGPNAVAGIKYFVFVVFPVIAFVAIIYFMSVAAKKAFTVTEVVFSGNEHLTDGELMSLTGLTGKENLIALSGAKVAEKMAESPWVRSIKVRKEFPCGLHIQVKESEPFALLDMKGRLFIIDERGKMLQELKNSPVPFLPVISGTPFGKEGVFSEALNLVRVIKEKGLMYEKDQIEIIAYKPNDLTVKLDGVAIKVGVGDYEDKLMRLMDLEREIKNRKMRVDYIDLRFARRAFVKPMKGVAH